MKRLLFLGLLLAGTGQFSAVWSQEGFLVQPTSLDFGTVPLGTNATRTFSVTVASSSSVGAITFNVSSQNPRFSVNPANFTVQPGASATVTVSFNPNLSGAYNGTIGVSGFNSFSQSAGTATVTVTGTGQSQAFTVSPDLVDFGNVPVGTGSNRTFQVSVPPVSGPSFSYNFAVTLLTGAGVFQAPESSFILSSGQSRDVTVTFAPTQIGAVSGSVRVTGSIGGEAIGTAVVSLNGVGTGGFATAPQSLTFGNVLIGCTGSQTFTVTPSGRLSFTLESSNPAFTIAPSSFTTANPQVVTVTFTPTTTGAASGVINISALQGTTPVPSFDLGMTATGFDIAAAPASIDFGSVPVGSTSASRTVRLTTSPVVQGAISATAASNNAAFQVSAVTTTGDSQITFAPSAQGTFSAIITYTITRADASSATCSITRRVTVTGTATPLALSLDPTSIDFGRVEIGTTSGPRTFTLTNGSTFGFAGTLTGSNPAFTFSPADISVNAGASQVFTVRFRPAAAGPVTGTLTLTLNSAGETVASIRTTLTLAVGGEGGNPAVLTVAPATLDFGDVTVGSSATRTITVLNTGGASAAVTASTGSASFAATPASFTLAAGASQTVNVTFTPAAAGPAQATATFAIAGSSRTVVLTGRGVVVSFSFLFTAGQASTPVEPGGTVPLPATSVGTENGVDFQISNTGTGAATIASATISNPAFSIEGLTLPAGVPPGGNLGFSIRFRPAAPGSVTGVLTIEGRTFTLTGTGLVGGVTITGAGATVAPATQPAIGIAFADRYSVPVNGTLTISFAANATGSPDEPAVQFPTGRTVSFTVPADSNTAVFAGGANQIAFQSGTVAGTITLRVTLQVGTTDVTPATPPSRAITIARAAPAIRSVTLANRTTTSVQLVILLLATSREVNQVVLRLTPSGTGNLQTTTITLDVSALFAQWYRSADAALNGSLCVLNIPLTIQGDIGAIRSISVITSNGDGASAAVDATL